MFLQSSPFIRTSKNTRSVQNVENNEIHVTMTDLLMYEMSQGIIKILS